MRDWPAELGNFISQLRIWMSEGHGVIICIDGAEEDPRGTEDEQGIPARARLALALAHDLDPSWDVRRNIVFGGDLMALVEHLEQELPHLVFVDDAESIFTEQWTPEAICAIEGNRHVLVMSIESIWHVPDFVRDAIDFRFQVSKQGKDVRLFQSDAKDVVRSDTEKRDGCLSSALLECFRRTHDSRAIERSVALLRSAVRNPRGSASQIEENLSHLTAALLDLYNAHGSVEALEEAVEHAKRLVDMTTPDSADYILHLSNLVEVLAASAEERRTMADLDGPLANLEMRLTKELPSGSERLHALTTVSKALCLKYTLERDPAVLDKAILSWDNVIVLTKKDMLERVRSLCSLASALLDKHERTGDPALFERAKTAIDSAISTQGIPSIEMPPLLTVTGFILSMEYESLGDASILARLIHTLEQAVNLTDRESPDFAGRSKNLASALITRYRRLGDCSDLERAITILRSSVRIAQGRSSDYPAIANALAIALECMYEKTLDERFHEEANQLLTAASPTSSSDFPYAFISWGNAANWRFRDFLETAEMGNLDTALELYTKALETAPAGSPIRRQLASNISSMLRVRFAYRGDLTDLRTALCLCTEALDATPPSSPSRPSMLLNSGTILMDIYKLTRDFNALEQALEAHQEAVQLTEETAIERSLCQNGLATAILARYHENNDKNYLGVAIRLLREAAANATCPRRVLPIILGNLCGALVLDFEALGGVTSLDEAIAAGDHALSLFAPQSPDSLGVRINLADAFRHHPKTKEDGVLRERAIGLYREACEDGLKAAPPLCAFSAEKWLRYSFDLSDWDNVAMAYKFLRDADKAILAIQHSPGGKRAWLSEFQGLSAMASFGLGKKGDAWQAALALERGRARLLSENLQRSHLCEVLSRIQPELLTQLLLIEERIRGSSISSTSSVEGSRMLHCLLRKKSLLEEYEKLTITIRGIPGFGSFLASPGKEDLEHAVRSILPGSSLVYLATTEMGTIAIIFTLGNAEVLFTPFSDGHLRRLMVGSEAEHEGGYLQSQLALNSNLSAMLPSVLDKIGAELIQPIASKLRTLGVHHVFFVVAGPLALLPLHAACWEENGARKCFIEEFVTSYVPTAVSIGSARETLNSLRGTSLFLGVGDPDGSLPKARIEVEEVGLLFPESQREVLVGQNASLESARDSALRTRYLNFASHGNYSLEFPPESGLDLAGGRLTLQDLFEGLFPIRSARLVVLSACQTAVTEFLRLPEEFLGLQSGFLYAGVPAVIGSLWPIDDDSTALLMVKFYELLMERGDEPFAPAIALREAQLWLRDLDAIRLEGFLDAHPSLRLRISRRNEARKRNGRNETKDPGPFRHPYYWAPFMMFGV